MLKLVPLRESDVQLAMACLTDAKEWSPKTDTFVPPGAILANPESRWYSALEGNECIGIVGFHNLNPADATGEMFTALAPKYRGQKLAEPLVRLQLDTGFQSLGLRRITMTTLEGSPSAHIADKLGIRKEGIFPAARLKNGTYPTALAYGLTRGEYYV